MFDLGSLMRTLRNSQVISYAREKTTRACKLYRIFMEAAHTARTVGTVCLEQDKELGGKRTYLCVTQF